MQHRNQQSGDCSLPSWTPMDQESSISSSTIFVWLFVYTYLFKTGNFLLSTLGWGHPCTHLWPWTAPDPPPLPSPCHPATHLLSFLLCGVVGNLQISASLLSSLLFVFCACPGAASRARLIAVCRQAAHHNHDNKVSTACPWQIPSLQMRGLVRQKKCLT